MNRAERLEKEWTEYLTARRSLEDIPHIARSIVLHILDSHQSAGRMKVLYEAEKSNRESCQEALGKARTRIGRVEAAEVALRKIADLIEDADEITDADAFGVEIFEIAMSALASRSTPHATIPDGWRAVPYEPTPAMIDAIAKLRLRRIKEAVEHGLMARESWRRHAKNILRGWALLRGRR